MSRTETAEPSTDALRQRIAQLEAELSASQANVATLEAERVKLHQAYRRALEQLELMRRRMFVAKAERSPSPEEQLRFEALLAEVDQLERALDAHEPPDGDAGDKPRGGKGKPRGRRDLSETDLPVERIDLLDPELEGRAERIGFEESSLLAYQRGGHRRLVLARAVYKQPSTASSDGEASATIVTAPAPRALFRRAMLAPSMIAHLLVSKYVMGTPFYRLESRMEHEGAPLDRGTMCRYAEDAGATLGAIVETMRAEAMQTAFCLSTDATGVAVQATQLDERSKGKTCKKGHFFVVLADRDHVFFEYQEKHTSAAVSAMFKGFGGYLQADAHAVYDALFRGSSRRDDGSTGPPTEVGCWSHARRHFWEAAVCKDPIGLEGLRKIDELFAAEAKLGKLAPSQKHALRQTHVRPRVEAFFAWVSAQLPLARVRGLGASALGYAVRQRSALERFLDDGRLRLDNNASERELRRVAVDRKNWLLFGSDDHAQAAANLLSLVASCKLHGLDPEAYFAEIIHVMPYWPRERHLELSPRYWARTRARLDETELDRELGPITVPPALPSEEQPLPR